MLATQRGESVADYLLFIFILALPVLGVIWLVGWMLFAWMPFSSEIVAYPIICDGEIQKDRCKGKLVLNDPETYKVFDERQIVILQKTSLVPRALRECAVRDKNNWTCDRWPVHGRLLMIDGELSLADEGALVAQRYISKWKWWACKFGDNQCTVGWLGQEVR